MRASKSVYLYGPDTLSREKRFKALVPSGRIYYLFENTWDEILEEVRYPSLFSFSLAGIRILSGKEERVSKAERKTIEEVVKFGVVISSEYSERSDLKNLLKASSCTMEYFRALYERERANLVLEELKKVDKEIDKDALILLVKTVGEDTLSLWGQVKKIMDYPPRRITVDDIKEIVPPLREYPVWELEVAIANKDYKKAQEVVENLKNRGNPPQMVVGSLNYIINRICRVDLSKEIFALDWKMKIGYLPWEAIHLFLLQIMEKC